MVNNNNLLKLMQLTNLGKSLELKDAFSSILNSTKYMAGDGNMAGYKTQILDLQNAVKGYSLDVVKLASSQVTLSTAQAKGIFSAKNLEGAELDAAIKTATLSASQKGATASTGTLSPAFKGLGTKIKVLHKYYCLE